MMGLGPGLGGRWASYVVELRHPVVDLQRCLNQRQKKLPCRVCAVCPAAVLADPATEDFSRCDDCGLCAAHCPAGAIAASYPFTQKLLELLRHSSQRLVLGCLEAPGEADLKLACLAAYPWELLAILSLKKVELSFLKGSCESCRFSRQMLLFDRALKQWQTFLGRSEAVAEFLTHSGQAKLQTRRQALGGLLLGLGRSASALLPEALRQNYDGDLWRRLLLKAAMEAEAGSKAQGSFYWTSPLVSEEKCRACGICAQLCPNQALSVAPTEEGRFFLAQFGWKCRGCGLCAAVCPWGAIEGFGAAQAKRSERPFLWPSAARSCRLCRAPCGPDDELCLSCKLETKKS